jgi:hypothetical protein
MVTASYSAQCTQLKALFGWIYCELQGKLWKSFFFLYHRVHVAIQNMALAAGESFSD